MEGLQTLREVLLTLHTSSIKFARCMSLPLLHLYQQNDFPFPTYSRNSATPAQIFNNIHRVHPSHFGPSVTHVMGRGAISRNSTVMKNRVLRHDLLYRELMDGLSCAQNALTCNRLETCLKKTPTSSILNC